MKIAVMQPYFLPYIGYFQLMASVDRFVLFDNVQYVRQGWINRNRILRNGQSSIITLPLKKDSRFLNINERYVSEVFSKTKILNQLQDAYRYAPYYDSVFPLLEKIISCDGNNLFDYLLHSLIILRNTFSLECEIVVCSELNIDHSLRSQEKILAICKEQNANTYINAPGGRELYERERFQQQRVSLQFIQPGDVHYPQFGAEFVPWLSIIDVMMFNNLENVSRFCRESWVIS
ncbi:WbqC family protein [Leclercia adecarboxylata]|uniref:WbqC family protein n=1 Tax=Leclercia adecarboxylata TaxID=83655 RepID=UPI00210008A0|nr:WbqC family protein [Leclercia adecarboxylata]